MSKEIENATGWSEKLDAAVWGRLAPYEELFGLLEGILMEADFLESLRIDPGDFEPRAAEHEKTAREAIVAFAERLAALCRRAQQDKDESFFKAAGIAAERVFAGPLLATHPTWMRALLVVEKMLLEGQTQGKLPTKAEIKAELLQWSPHHKLAAYLEGAWAIGTPSEKREAQRDLNGVIREKEARGTLKTAVK